MLRTLFGYLPYPLNGALLRLRNLLFHRREPFGAYILHGLS